MEQKKPTKAQIENRIKNAVLHIDNTKETKRVYFEDKGLRLTINDDYAIIETSHHRHVFDRITSLGMSRPYIYIEQFINIANNTDCKVTNANGESVPSYQRLFETLEKNSDQTDYNLCWYVDKWLFNIFQPLYSIGESGAESFLVYESYLHNIARNSLILSEHKEQMTNGEFIDGICKHMSEFTENVRDKVLFEAKTDEEIINEEIDSMREAMNMEIS